MNYKKRISAILLASALSVGLLAGCGGNSDSGSASGDSVEITNVSYDPTRELYQHNMKAVVPVLVSAASERSPAWRP